MVKTKEAPASSAQRDFQGSVTLGRMVEDQRKKIGLSREQLGERTGLSYNMIAKIELGRRLIPMESIPAFADALCVGSDVLYVASGVLPPDIQGRVKDATAKQIKAVRRIMTA